MLISFEAKNFLTFDESGHEFTMETGRARGKRNHVMENRKCNLLKFSAIFGKNSSGKSNFIRSIQYARRFIIKGIGKDREICRLYNRTKPENRDKPSEFIFKFLIAGKIYTYKISIHLNSLSIMHESLLCEESTLFIRDFQLQKFDYLIRSKSDVINIKGNLFFDTVKEEKKVFFLKDMNTSKGNLYEENDPINILQTLYTIFKDSIKIVYPETRVGNDKLFYNFETEMANLLEHFDFDIETFKFVKDTPENVFKYVPENIISDILDDVKEKLSISSDEKVFLFGAAQIIKFEYQDNDLLVHTLKTLHKNGVEYDLNEESDGLRRILELMSILIAPEDGSIFIVDEIERSLSAPLTKGFVDYFLNHSKSKNVQLIVTTHETRLLDFELLRKDEIWFFDKVAGNTTISPLTSYDGIVRADSKNIDLAFMDGRFGGIPNIRR
ncbi:AAA domain, putative AbiEii toxin, Type IV TA system [anaerobic digester metagenome]